MKTAPPALYEDGVRLDNDRRAAEDRGDDCPDEERHAPGDDHLAFGRNGAKPAEDKRVDDDRQSADEDGAEGDGDHDGQAEGGAEIGRVSADHGVLDMSEIGEAQDRVGERDTDGDDRDFARIDDRVDENLHHGRSSPGGDSRITDMTGQAPGRARAHGRGAAARVYLSVPTVSNLPSLYSMRSSGGLMRWPRSSHSIEPVAPT